MLQRPASNEARRPPLGKRDVDRIEVARDDGVGEDGARLARDLRSEVAVGEVREGEEAHARLLPDLRGLHRRRVARLVRTCPLLVGERGVVDEDVGGARDLEHRARRARVAREHDLPPRAGRPEHLLRVHPASLFEDDDLAALEGAVARARLDAQRPRRLDVEATGAGRLDERVAVRSRPVAHLEDDDSVPVSLERVAWTKLDEVEAVRELPEDPLERREQVHEPGRPVHGHRQLAPAQGERLQHPGKTQVVVGVVMRDENVGELDQTDPGAQELTLRSLAAVEEQALASTSYQRRRGCAARRRNTPGRSEEDEVEVHERSVRARLSPFLPARTRRRGR